MALLEPKKKKRSNRGKTERFEAIKVFPNVLEFCGDIKGQWHSSHFENDNPITVELACGKGEYTIAMARQFPDKNFIGVDIKGERIYIGAKQAINEKLDNAAFLRILIDDLDQYFAPNEVEEMWITFPDPYPKKRHAKNRLTSPKFLEMYKHVINPGGMIHLKTDAEDLYHYSKETVTAAGYTIEQAVEDIYSQPLVNPLLEIKTNFENRHLAEGRKIYYLSFRI